MCPYDCNNTTAGGNLFNRVTLKSPFDIMASEAIAVAGAGRGTYLKDILTGYDGPSINLVEDVPKHA